MKKTVFIIAAFLLVMAYPAAQAQNIGDKAPDFSYTDLQGTAHSLSDYSGKVLFLFVFGNGCPYCKAIGNDTEKKVNEVYRQRGDFQALALDTWNNSTVATVGEFQSTTKITYPLLLNAKSFQQLYSTSYDRVIVIDQDGIIRHKNKSLDTESDLDNAIAVIEELFMVMDVDDVGDGLSTGLAKIYPNPSSDQVNIRFTMEGHDRVSIRVFNPIGQEVKRIVDNTFPSGEHEHSLNVSDFSQGIYFIRMETAGKAWTQKFQVSR